MIFGSLIPIIFSLETTLVLTSHKLHNQLYVTGFKDIISIPVRDVKMVNRDILNMVSKMNLTFEQLKIETVSTA